MQIIKKNSIFFVSILFTIIIGIFICRIKGYGSDIDTYSLIKTFLNIIENGTYNPSRYYGHPIPEVLLGYLSYNFGAFVTSYFCYLMFIFSLYFFYVSFANDKIKMLEDTLDKLDLVNSFEIIKFDNKNIYIKIIYNGSPNKFINQMKFSNILVNTEKQIWEIR